MRKWWAVSSLIFVLFVAGCLEKPEGPTNWDIQLATPLIRDSLLFDSLKFNFDSTFGISYDSLGILTLDFSDTFPPETLQSILDLPEVHDTFAINLHDFFVIDIDTTTTSITLFDLVPPAFRPLLPDSGYGVIPPFHNTVSTTDTVQGVHWTSIRRGKIYVAIRNFVPLTIDTLNIALNNSRNENILNLRFNNIPFGGEQDTIIRLSNVWVDSITTYRIELSSSGSPGDSVWIRRDDSLVIVFSFDSLRVDSIAISGGRLHGQDSSQKTFDIEHGILVDTVAFSNGLLAIHVFNSLGFNILSNMHIPEFNMDTILNIRPNGVTDFPIELSTHPYVRIHPDSNAVSVALSVDAQIPGDSVVVLSPSDSLGIALDLTGAQFDRAAITFSEPYIDTIKGDTITIGNVDLPENFNISSALLRLNIVNGIRFSPAFSLHVVGFNDDGDSLVLPISPITLRPGTPYNPETTSISIDAAPLINFHPTSVAFGGIAQIDGNGAIYSNSFIGGNFSINVPFIFSIGADTAYTDTYDLSLNDDFLRALIDSSLLKEVSVILRIRNRFPFGFSKFNIVLLDTTSGDSAILTVNRFPPAPTDSLGIPIRDTAFVDTIAADSSFLQFLTHANKVYANVIWPAIHRAALFRDSKLTFSSYGFLKARVDVTKLEKGGQQ